MDFYSEVSEFFEKFYRAAFENEHLFKVCFVRIAEYHGEGIFSRFSDVSIASVENPKLSSHYEFTVDEIKPYAGENLEEVLEWYDGYTISPHHINPVSFSKWLYRKRPDDCWVRTSSLGLSILLKWHTKAILETVINLAKFADFKLKIKPFSRALHFHSPTEKIHNAEIYQLLPLRPIWNFLILAGYLSYQPDDPTNPIFEFACVPTTEIWQHWTEVKPALIL